MKKIALFGVRGSKPYNFVVINFSCILCNLPLLPLVLSVSDIHYIEIINAEATVN